MADNPEVSAAISEVLKVIPNIEEGLLQLIWSPTDPSHGFHITPYSSAVFYELTIDHAPRSNFSIDVLDQLGNDTLDVIESGAVVIASFFSTNGTVSITDSS